jgi:hypoxanthine phosphoribosyltransferase
LNLTAASEEECYHHFVSLKNQVVSIGQGEPEELPSEISEVLFTEDQIEQRIRELGVQISEDYSCRKPLVIAALKGAAVFHADLIRQLSIDLTVEFVSASSYYSSRNSSGSVRIFGDFNSDLKGADVLLVEDIVDTGFTLKRLSEEILKYGPASFRVCSLLSKPERRKIDVVIDYLGFEISDHFVVGFGLDYGEKYRNLPFIGILTDSD